MKTDLRRAYRVLLIILVVTFALVLGHADSLGWSESAALGLASWLTAVALEWSVRHQVADEELDALRRAMRGDQ